MANSSSRQRPSRRHRALLQHRLHPLVCSQLQPMFHPPPPPLFPRRDSRRDSLQPCSRNPTLDRPSTPWPRCLQVHRVRFRHRDPVPSPSFRQSSPSRANPIAFSRIPGRTHRDKRRRRALIPFLPRPMPLPMPPDSPERRDYPVLRPLLASKLSAILPLQTRRQWRPQPLHSPSSPFGQRIYRLPRPP